MPSEKMDAKPKAVPGEGAGGGNGPGCARGCGQVRPMLQTCRPDGRANSSWMTDLLKTDTANIAGGPMPYWR
jgi:hypothetical protein